jgi:hypothetical protein
MFSKAFTRTVVSLLLLLASMPIFASTVMIGESQVASTSTTMYTATTTRFQSTITNTPTQIGKYCWWYYVQESAGVNNKWMGTFHSDNKVNFYVLSSQRFHEWEANVQTDCSAKPTGPLVSQLLTSSYSFNFTTPSADTYYFVFFDPVLGQGFIFSFSLQLQYVTTVSYYLASVTSSHYVAPATTSETTVTSSGPFAGIPAFPMEAILAGLLFGIVLIISKRVRRRSLSGF